MKKKIVRLHKELIADLVSEFDQLDYAGKLRFMDEHFKGFAKIEENELTISVFPTKPDETRLYNEWRINLFRKALPRDEFTDYFLEWLKDRYNTTISGIKKSNAYPDLLIQQYIAEQLNEYEHKLKTVQDIVNKHNGVWDLSVKVIDDYPAFMRAKAVANYVGYLKLQQSTIKPIPSKPPRIPTHVLKRVHREFDNVLWEGVPSTKFIELFDPDNTKQGQLKGKISGFQVLIAYLFKQICIRHKIPFTNLEPRVGSFDRANYGANHRPQKGEMFDTIERFLKKLTTNRGLKM